MHGPLSLARLLKRLAIAFVASYLVAGGALYTMQRSLTYDPHPLLFVPDAQAIAIPARDVTLHGWVVNPGQSRALVYFGGKGESVERDVAFFRKTLPHDTVYLVPYRGYGPNAGTPTEAGLDADALVVHDWVRARHGHVAIMGRSLGTGVATWLASKRPVERLVLATPYDSVLNIARERYPVFPVAWLLKDRYESWRSAAAVKASVLVLLAQNDQAVPRAHSDVLIAHFPKPPTVVVVPHSGHNNIHNAPVYASALREFMEPGEAAPPAPPVPSR